MRCFNQVRHRLCFENTGARRRRRVLGEWACASCPRIRCYKQHTFFGRYGVSFGRNNFIPEPERYRRTKGCLAKGAKGTKGGEGNFQTGPPLRAGASKWCRQTKLFSYPDTHPPDFRPASVPSLSSRPSRDSVESRRGDRAAFARGAAPSGGLLRAEDFLQQFAGAGGGVLADELFLLGDHLEQAVGGFLGHVFVHVERGGVVVQLAEQ